MASREEDSAHDEVLLRQTIDGVALLTINRPQRMNSWSGTLADAMAETFREFEVDPAIKSYVLTGAGDRAFCAGADLSDGKAHKVTSPVDFIVNAPQVQAPGLQLLRLRKPIVAAVNGYAIGAGFILALCSDIVLASSNASFSMPQIKLGILPLSQGISRLAQWVGRGRAQEIALTGRAVGADEACSIGIVSRVIDVEALVDQAVVLAGQMGDLPPAAFALSKESLSMTMEAMLSQGAAADVYRWMALAMTPDAADRHEGWRGRKDSG